MCLVHAGFAGFIRTRAGAGPRAVDMPRLWTSSKRGKEPPRFELAHSHLENSAADHQTGRVFHMPTAIVLLTHIRILNLPGVGDGDGDGAGAAPPASRDLREA